MKHLDLLTVPLENVNLIEASAGTGKTFSIANLFLRLVLEKELPVQEILVVTFTDAATKELKERIRENMLAAQKTSQADNQEKTDVVTEIINQYCESVNGSKEKATKLLRRALLNIDEMAVYTIHGFCQRMLNENAFESKVAFDLELIPDAQELLEEVVDDYWRRKTYLIDDDMDTVTTLFTRKDLLQIANEFGSSPNLQLTSQDLYKNQLNCELDQLRFKTHKYSDERGRWLKCISAPNFKSEMVELLVNSGIMNAPFKTITALDDKLTSAITGITNYPDVSITTFKPFSTEEIIKKTTKNFRENPPTHKFFEFCSFLTQQHKDDKKELTALKKEIQSHEDKLEKCKEVETKTAEIGPFIDYVRTEFEKRKLSSQTQTYDDILKNLQKALHGDSESAKSFLKLIREKFKVAMIDEFQDTDPVQSDIFKKIFIDSSELPLFMIGDPKQSIYGFRGADVFAYLNVKGIANKVYSLGTNYRSENSMVEAVNFFFTQKVDETESAINPFVYDKIDGKSGINYNSVKGCDKEFKLVDSGESNNSSLQLCYIEHPNGEVYSNSAGERKTIDFVTGEIKRLLSGKANFKADGEDNRDVRPGDIAVLTSSHSEARAVQQSLGRRNIVSVVQNSGNVLASDEARDVQLFLTATMTLREQDIKAFLTSSFAEVTASELYSEIKGDSVGNVIVEWVNQLMELKQLWLDKGFVTMFQKLLRVTNLRSRLLKNPNGERELTNFLHLGELLHKAEQDHSLCQDGLVDWFDSKLSEDIKEDDEYLMRLESDSDTVKIMTVHKSKGLEFKIVFCPFFWKRKFEKSPKENCGFSFQKDGKYYYELDSNAKGPSRQLWKKQKLAEEIRLVYVGLTRAVSRCYVVAGDFNNAGATALSYLTEAGNLDSEEKLVEFISTPPKTINFGKLKETFSLSGCIDVQIVNDDVNDDFDSTATGLKQETVALEDAEEFTRTVRRDWGIGSFSGLTRFASHGHKAVEQIKDHDDEEVESSVEKSTKDEYKFFDFPRGATVGSAVHEIFEDIDFTAEPESFNVVIEQKLKNFGLARGADEESYKIDLEDKISTLNEMVSNVLAAPIKELGDFRLNQLSCRDRLVEMQFYYKIKTISADKLETTFAQYGVDVSGADFARHLGGLNFSLKRGFMTGFIDLLFEHDDKFYVLDWKTNHLGSSFNNYSKPSMVVSMTDSYYILQYHLYVIALHLYLQKRLGDSYDYDKCMGGVVYAYVRGMHPEHEGKGVFYDRPSYELITALTELIVGVK